MLQFWIYHGESYFLRIHEIKMGGHHARFGAITVQWYGKGEYSLQNTCFQCARAKGHVTRGNFSCNLSRNDDD